MRTSQPRNRRVLSGDAEMTAAHAAIAQQRRHDIACRIDRHRERDALSAENDRGVDADDLRAARDERTAGVARIERGVGLDQVLHQAHGARAQRSAERADDAGRHRVLEAKRIADRDDQLTRPQRRRIAERRRDQVGRRDAQNGEISVRIVTDEVRHEIPAVWQRHADACRTACSAEATWSRRRGDDVAVGEDEAVGREDESRSRAARIHFDDRWTDEVHGRDHRM